MDKNINNHHNREKGVVVFNGGDSHTTTTTTTTAAPETRSASDFVLQWGNRKRLRCMKVQAKDRFPASSSAVRADRRVVRSDLNGSKEDTLNLRQRPVSPNHRILRNSEIAMKGGHSNGVAAQDKRAAISTATANNHHANNSNSHHHHNNISNNNGGVGSGSGSDVAHEGKKGANGAGTSSGSDAMPAVWPPKFVIALTNKEKEEDFYAFKGSKLPQRPKKRSKFIQRTLNMVTPGTWLSDLTMERYEVREKKTSKKRPRGLKAMGNMESDSE